MVRFSSHRRVGPASTTPSGTLTSRPSPHSRMALVPSGRLSTPWKRPPPDDQTAGHHQADHNDKADRNDEADHDEATEDADRNDSAACPMPGDVNGDGKVDPTDAAIIVKNLYQPGSFTALKET